jgi:hypothetical protein
MTVTVAVAVSAFWIAMFLTWRCVDAAGDDTSVTAVVLLLTPSFSAGTNAVLV